MGVCRYCTFSTKNKHPVLTRPISNVWNPFSAPKLWSPGLTLDFCLEMFELNGGQWLQIVETTLKHQFTTMDGDCSHSVLYAIVHMLAFIDLYLTWKRVSCAQN